MAAFEPEITVLMPAYNAGKFIAEAIASVLAQTFRNFELLIINDGSTDNTLAVIKSFVDRRIVVINQSNGGVANALNIGLKYARADYIARFDADDICYPSRLQVQYDFAKQNPEYDIFGSAADYVDVNGEYVFNYQPPGFTNDELHNLNYTLCPFVHSTVFYKKELIVNAGGYDSYAIGFEDHLLWRRLFSQYKVMNTCQSLIKVRLNPESVTLDEKWYSKRYLKLKYAVLQKGDITASEANVLHQLASQQKNHKLKHGAYYALLAKKFLWNNHNPDKARLNLLALMKIDRLNYNGYLLFLLSFLPGNFLLKLYQTLK